MRDKNGRFNILKVSKKNVLYNNTKCSTNSKKNVGIDTKNIVHVTVHNADF